MKESLGKWADPQDSSNNLEMESEEQIADFLLGRGYHMTSLDSVQNFTLTIYYLFRFILFFISFINYFLFDNHIVSLIRTVK